MSTTYSVAIQYKKDLGYIEYDAEKKAATVVLDDEDGRRAVEKYLAEKHEIGDYCIIILLYDRQGF